MDQRGNFIEPPPYITNNQMDPSAMLGMQNTNTVMPLATFQPAVTYSFPSSLPAYNTNNSYHNMQMHPINVSMHPINVSNQFTSADMQQQYNNNILLQNMSFDISMNNASGNCNSPNIERYIKHPLHSDIEKHKKYNQVKTTNSFPRISEELKRRLSQRTDSVNIPGNNVNNLAQQYDQQLPPPLSTTNVQYANQFLQMLNCQIDSSSEPSSRKHTSFSSSLMQQLSAPSTVSGNPALNYVSEPTSTLFEDKVFSKLDNKLSRELSNNHSNGSQKNINKSEVKARNHNSASGFYANRSQPNQSLTQVVENDNTKASQYLTIASKHKEELTNTNMLSPNIVDEDNFIGSINDIELYTQSFLAKFDSKSFDNLQEYVSTGSPSFEPKPLTSPMSVESSKTDSSSGSLKDLHNLKTLSLAISPTSHYSNDMEQSPLKELLSPKQDEKNKTAYLNKTPSSETSNYSSNTCTSFNSSNSLAKANRVPQNVPTFTNLIEQDNLFKMDCLDSMELLNAFNGINHAIPQQDNVNECFSTSNLQGAKRTYKDLGKIGLTKSKKKLKPSGSNLLSKRPSKKNTAIDYEKNTLTDIETNPQNSIGCILEDVKTKLPTSRSIVTETKKDKTKHKRLKGLYFQNQSFYKFRKNLRELTKLQSVVEKQYQTNDNKIVQKASKLFLNQLTATSLDEYVLDSVTPSVKDGKDINLKNMTKRKITIYNDVPAEMIHKYSESNKHPFQYIVNDNGGNIVKPNEKLMSILTNKIKTEPPIKEQKELDVS